MSIVVVKENLPPGSENDHRPRGNTFDFHDALHLFLFVFACEQWVSAEQLIKDAPERPHVDTRCVVDTQHDLRRSVEPALDVSVELFTLVGRAAKVDHLDPRLVRFP